ncbi:hypothetical protein AL060_12250 [Pseudomonas syringae pv. rhaphiolepidis]|nr:hypothetical protein AL060_12250 [Pseudomonas syringae pv. rhaphiolepidis]
MLLAESVSTHWLNIGKSFATKTWLDKTAIGGALRMQSPFGHCQPVWSEIGKNLLPGIALFNEMAAMKRTQYWVGSFVAKDLASVARLWRGKSLL